MTAASRKPAVAALRETRRNPATAIVTRVNAHPSPPALVPGLYLKKQTETMAQFAFGGRTGGDLFGSVVRVSPTETGCTGNYEVHHWTESGADVSGKAEMAKIRSRIADAVQAASGEVQMA